MQYLWPIHRAFAGIYQNKFNSKMTQNTYGQSKSNSSLLFAIERSDVDCNFSNELAHFANSSWPHCSAKQLTEKRIK